MSLWVWWYMIKANVHCTVKKAGLQRTCGMPSINTVLIPILYVLCRYITTTPTLLHYNAALLVVYPPIVSSLILIIKYNTTHRSYFSTYLNDIVERDFRAAYYHGPTLRPGPTFRPVTPCHSPKKARIQTQHAQATCDADAIAFCWFKFRHGIHRPA